MSQEIPATGVKLSVVIPVYNERYLVGELVRRVLAVSAPEIREMEVLLIDDGSKDGSREILRGLAAEHPTAIRLLEQEKNQGKGAAIRRGIAEATGDLMIFQDADLEYDPRDYPRLVRPFLEDGADVVYGSRFLPSERRRVLYYRHSLGNQLLTTLSNLFTNLNLTDMETCYKVFRAPLLKSIPIRSNDFAMEPEITAKVAKRECRIFEVPISYLGRTYREGKKIGWKDGFKALRTMVKYWLIDDLYAEDEYGSHILHSLERAQPLQPLDGRRHRALRRRPGAGDRRRHRQHHLPGCCRATSTWRATSTPVPRLPAQHGAGQALPRGGPHRPRGPGAASGPGWGSSTRWSASTCWSTCATRCWRCAT